MIIFKEFTFDSAHKLPNVPDGHKCKNLHGHTYRIRVYIKGDVDPKMGWVMDFTDLKVIWKKLEINLDHKYLNDIPGLENPTAEVFAKYIYDKLKPDLELLYKIELYETPSSGVEYMG